MGLDTFADGLPWEENFHGSYRKFNRLRDEIVRVAYGEKLFFAYHDYNHEFTQSEKDEWNLVCDDDLDLFLLHPDDNGEFSPDECRRVYAALRRVQARHDLGTEECRQMLQKWISIFEYCGKNETILYFR